KAAAKGYGVFSIRLRGCGFFPNARRPAVLWCGVDCDELGGLQHEIDNRLAALDFEKETRPFSAHLTLARFRDPHGLFWLAKEVEKIKDSDWGQFPAKEITLYQSILHRTGAEYRALETFPLGLE
ncbi:MAG TPA: RNA 2',3'-cyclic phosphodiesterase, partial [Acidobacteriota bacterium]|nr:RNA 2',3'-cyclic phosphodiesterase [Acidobacteriota bacterium]